MPLLDIQTRLREVGRIRIGEKGPKGEPRKLTVFRLTSHDRRAIEKAASIYGGTVKECTEKDLKGQFEVITNACELPFFVSPSEPSQWYETWSGGGCVRRCDGCTDMISGNPCQCDPDNRTCKPTTRLPVILPDLPGLGTWRLESHGFNAAIELVQSFNYLRTLAGNGTHTEAILALEERISRKDGRTNRFMVPVIRIGITPRQLMVARENLALASQADPETGELPMPSAPALVAPTHEDEHHRLKDANPRGAVWAIAAEMKLPPHADPFKGMYYVNFGKVLGRDLTTLSTLTDDDWSKLAVWLRAVKDGARKMPKAFQDAIDGASAFGAEDPFDDVPLTTDKVREEAS